MRLNRIAIFVGFLSLPIVTDAQVAPQKPPADAGRELRLLMLKTSPTQAGVVPTAAFPRIFGVVLDWPIGGENTATIVSMSDGHASLYTTSTFGILGGIGHESIRSAASKFVALADRYFDDSSPAQEFPYPPKGRVRFYLLTYDGVRVIDTDQVAAERGKYASLFGLGQDVLTELRRVTEKRQ